MFNVLIIYLVYYFHILITTQLRNTQYISKYSTLNVIIVIVSFHTLLILKCHPFYNNAILRMASDNLYYYLYSVRTKYY